MVAFVMTPEHDGIAAEIGAAEKALERYAHVSQADPAEIERARNAVGAAVDADMPGQFYFGLQRYLSIYDRPAREAEFRKQAEGGDRGDDR